LGITQPFKKKNEIMPFAPTWTQLQITILSQKEKDKCHVALLHKVVTQIGLGFPCGSVSKESACSADLGSIPGLGRSPGEGNGNPPQYVLTWKISWTEEPGGLQSMGSERARHD